MQAALIPMRSKSAATNVLDYTQIGIDKKCLLR